MKTMLAAGAAGFVLGYVCYAAQLAVYLRRLGYLPAQADAVLRDKGRVVGIGLN